MNGKYVLSLCDKTGNMVRPWAEAGYTCYIVDLQHPPGWSSGGPNIIRWGGSIMDFTPRSDVEFAAVFAFPPCTHLAVSGARWFKAKGMGKLIEGLTLVERCRQIAEDEIKAPFLIENPISTLSTYWRKPNHMFDPCDYGGYEGGEEDAYTKKTCLWTGHGFKMPEKKRIKPVLGSKMHRLPPSEERANLRSATPMGFARAVFEANRGEG